MREILIIEDDLRLGTFTQITLDAKGYQTKLVLTAGAGRKYLQTRPVDLVILDLDLPDLSGIELCQELREHYNFPIVFFSAEGSLQKKVAALDAGANDYIVKPIDIRELLARVNAQLRAIDHKKRVLMQQRGNLRYETDSNQFHTQLGLLPLSGTARKILILLFPHENKVFSKEAIYRQAWGNEYIESRDGHLVENQISRLRKQLKKHQAGSQIKTRYGQGYYLHTSLD